MAIVGPAAIAAIAVIGPQVSCQKLAWGTLGTVVRVRRLNRIPLSAAGY
jgi:hypothetical protein